MKEGTPANNCKGKEECVYTDSLPPEIIFKQKVYFRKQKNGNTLITIHGRFCAYRNKGILSSPVSFIWSSVLIRSFSRFTASRFQQFHSNASSFVIDSTSIKNYQVSESLTVQNEKDELVQIVIDTVAALCVLQLDTAKNKGNKAEFIGLVDVVPPTVFFSVPLKFVCCCIR